MEEQSKTKDPLINEGQDREGWTGNYIVHQDRAPPGTFSLALQAADLHDATIEIKTDLSISLRN
jgi:hypothetical protein